MYDQRNSINEILENVRKQSGEVILSLSLPAQMIDQIPEEMRSCTLEELDQRIEMPKGMPPLSEIIMDGANITDEIVRNKKYRFIPLWKDENGEYVPQDSNDKASVFLLASGAAPEEKRPAVIISPGGGYEMVAMNAG